MKIETIKKLSETTFYVTTDLYMSNCKNWSGKMQLNVDTLERIPGIIYNYCPKITIPNHADRLRALAVGESITVG